MTKVFQGTLDSVVPPGRILGGHAQNQLDDLLHDRWPSRSLPGKGPLQGDEFLVPGEDRVWRNECGKLE